MSQTPPPADSFNPFEAPRTRIGAEVEAPAGPGNSDAELVRRQYLGHEASVRSIGWLAILGASFLGLAVVAGVVNLLGDAEQVRTPGARQSLLIGTGAAALIAVALAALGRGLINLRPWARWLAVVPVGFATFADPLLLILGITSVTETDQPRPMTIAVAGVILPLCGFALYLLLSPGGAVVCSRPYRGVIEQTPHLHQKMNPFLWACLAVASALIVTGVLAVLDRLRELPTS